MPHPLDQALAAAVGTVIRRLESQGWTTKQLAAQFEVTEPTVNRWKNGERTPRLEQLPTFDRLAGQPKGHVLRLAHYVDDGGVDVIAAIEHAPDLTDLMDREALAGLYEVFRRRSAD
jgi:transcriptional regulator with XRE-family HTH domain